MTTTTAHKYTTGKVGTIERQAGKPRHGKISLLETVKMYEWADEVAPSLSPLAQSLHRTLLRRTAGWAVEGVLAHQWQLAAHCNMSVRSIRNAQAELVDAGLVEVTFVGGFNLYSVVVPRDLGGDKLRSHRTWDEHDRRLKKSRGRHEVPTRSARGAGGLYSSNRDSKNLESKTANQTAHHADLRRTRRLSSGEEDDSVRERGETSNPGENSEIVSRAVARRREVRNSRTNWNDRAVAKQVVRRRYVEWVFDLPDCAHDMTVEFIATRCRGNPAMATAARAYGTLLAERLGPDFAGSSSEVPADILEGAERAVENAAHERDGYGFSHGEWAEVVRDVLLRYTFGTEVEEAI